MQVVCLEPGLLPSLLKQTDVQDRDRLTVRLDTKNDGQGWHKRDSPAAGARFTFVVRIPLQPLIDRITRSRDGLALGRVRLRPEVGKFPQGSSFPPHPEHHLPSKLLR